MVKLRKYLFVLFLSLETIVFSQNLIKNGSFEEHGSIRCLSCDMIYGKFPSLVYQWDNMNTAGILCDKSYNQTSDEKTWGHCPFEKMDARHGASMMMQNYMPSSGKNGQATYLISKISEPLTIGEKYEISIWVFVPEKKGIDPEFDQHLGVAFLPGKFSPKDRGLYEIPCLTKEKIEKNKWVQLKWYFSPLCSADYLLIGVFKTESWPKSRSYEFAPYYIDNVSLIKIADPEILSSENFTSYCSRYEIEKNKSLVQNIDDIYINFETNSYILNDAGIKTLDSFALIIKKNPDVVFEISGHTDSIGNGNIMLSQNRAKTVFNYLVDNHKIPEFRFITNSYGSTKPLLSNTSQEGRNLNRRVEISQTDLDLRMLFYRKAIESVKFKNNKEAYMFLKKWLYGANSEIKILLLFDPRFEALKKEKGWTLIANQVKESYKIFRDANYAFWLDSLRLENLRTRGLTTKLNNLLGPIDDLDSSWILPYPKPEDFPNQDMEHLGWMLQSLEKKGWPKTSDVGKNAASAPFFIMQHAADSSVYSKWLPIIKSRCIEGEAEWSHYAMMYDRYNLDIGKPQRYGTNASIINGKLSIILEDSIEKANENRAKIGMPLLSPAEIEIINKSNQK